MNLDKQQQIEANKSAARDNLRHAHALLENPDSQRFMQEAIEAPLAECDRILHNAGSSPEALVCARDQWVALDEARRHLPEMRETSKKIIEAQA